MTYQDVICGLTVLLLAALLAAVSRALWLLVRLGRELFRRDRWR